MEFGAALRVRRDEWIIERADATSSVPPKPQVDLGNICCLTNFLSGLDEEHFRLVHVAIEAKAVPAVAAMLRYAETG